METIQLIVGGGWLLSALQLGRRLLARQKERSLSASISRLHDLERKLANAVDGIQQINITQAEHGERLNTLEQESAATKAGMEGMRRWAANKVGALESRVTIVETGHS